MCSDDQQKRPCSLKRNRTGAKRWTLILLGPLGKCILKSYCRLQIEIKYDDKSLSGVEKNVVKYENKNPHNYELKTKHKVHGHENSAINCRVQSNSATSISLSIITDQKQANIHNPLKVARHI